MQTNSLFGNSSTTGSTQDPTANIAGNTAAQTQDMFTKLLVAQIQNQDPLSPTDPSQFVNQLTQLSQTESLQNLSTLTSANASVLQSLQVLAMGAQVGSDVMVESDTVQVDGSKISGQINQASSSSETTLLLTGVDGVQHAVSLGMQAAGAVPFTIDPTALGLPSGSYQVSATTSSQETPSVDVTGRLNGVRLSSSGSVLLNVANVGDISPSAITGFNGKSSTATQ